MRRADQLVSAELKLVFEPDHGGKWRSLSDQRTRREWLWSNPHIAVCRSATAIRLSSSALF